MLFVCKLPDLSIEALQRIDQAKAEAIDLLLVKTGTAWQALNAPEIRACRSAPHTKALSRSTVQNQATPITTLGKEIPKDLQPRSEQLDTRIIALQLAQRAYRNARIQAAQLLFDAMAVEYIKVDNAPGAYSRRLRQVVLPAVRQSLPLWDDDHLILGTLQAMVIQWDDRQAAEASFVQSDVTSTRETPNQIIDRLRGYKRWTIEQLAAQAGLDPKQVYNVKQGKNVHTETLIVLATTLGCEPGDLLPHKITPNRGGRSGDRTP